MRFLRLLRTFSTHATRERVTVLGIETSCDDTCIAVVNSERKVLSQRRVSFVESQRNLRGISPFASAQQHRANIDGLVDECVAEAGVRLSDLNAIGCTVQPGLVLCLKVGLDKALALCRDYRVGFIPIHHMRAHALISRLVFDDVEFPFVCLLISGGHGILCISRGPEQFEILCQTKDISPGEAIDKVARSAGIAPLTHYGKVVEEYAKRSNNLMRYVTRLPSIQNADFDFSFIRNIFTGVLNKSNDIDLEDFCANLQFIVTGHLCQKLDVALQYIENAEIFKFGQSRNLVLSGGVAANSFIRSAVERIAAHHGFNTRIPPKELVVDNAVMISWTAIEMLLAGTDEYFPSDKLPSSVYVRAKVPIGQDSRDSIQQFKPERKLRLSSIHPNSPELLFNQINYS